MPRDEATAYTGNCMEAQQGSMVLFVIMQAVRAFTLPPAAAAAHVSAIHRLSAACGDGAWAPTLQRDCEAHLGRYVDAASKGTLAGDAAKAEWQACTAAFTAGEVNTSP